jgi:hypothetical protein
MKNRILAATILIFLLALGFYFRRNHGGLKNSSAGDDKISQDAAVARALANQDSNTVAIINSNFARVQPTAESAGSAAAVTNAPAGPASPLQFTNFEPATVLENVGRAVRLYGDMFGGNPVGNNAEITAALAGDNPRHINFLNAEAGMRVNENGEMVDPWGTPYFFHQLSGHEMEIRSAGEDRKMWTPDDLVAR